MNRTPTAHFPDLSHYEPVVDFHKVTREGGAPLVITKCSQGATSVDPTYADFAKRIHSVGAILGAYHYLDPLPAPETQMAHFLATAKLQKGDLQPVIDAEAAGLTKETTFEALYSLEHRRYRPILYCSLAFWRDVLGSPVRWLLWLAAYRAALPALPDSVRLFAWQHTDCANFPGVAKPCDSSYLYVPLARLKVECCI